MAQSNIVPDGTLGNENSVVINNFLGAPIEVVAGGAARGTNLFHSFQEFNVSEGRGAYFFSPSADIQNILARVTGNNRSEILGTLGTFQIIGGNFAPANANLFLINPNGILFGQYASLDVGGSFVGSTANAIQFGNQGFLSASAPNVPPLLTVNPSALLFNQIKTASIINQSNQDVLGLAVPDGKSLLLVGGDVRLEGGRLTAPGGRIELGGVAGSGTVGLSVDGNDLRLSFAENVALADISLTNRARVGGNDLFLNQDGGEIRLQGNRVTIGGQSFIFSYTFAEQDGKGISIRASQLSLAEDSFISTNVLFGSGKGGDVSINAGDLIIQSGARIQAETTIGSGNGGNLTIDANRLSITGIGRVSTNTGDLGNGGNLTVRASEIELSGTTADGQFSSGIFARVSQGAQGNGGILNIETSRLVVRDGAQVSTEVFGEGQGGNLTINATESVQLLGRSANSQFPSAVFTRTYGQTSNAVAGDLTITTGRLLVRDGAQVSASTFGSGDAGDLIIGAAEVELSGASVNGFPSGLFAQANRGEGNGGNLTIETGKLIVREGAQVTTATLDRGEAGNLQVTATESVEVNGTSIFGVPSRLLSQTDGDGNAGNLTIKTGRLIVTGGAEISSATTEGKGQGGSLTVTAPEFVEVSGRSADGNPSNLITVTLASGSAGDLTINTTQLTVKDRAFVSTSTLGSGDAGDLTIDSRQLFIQRGGFVSAGTGSFSGGKAGDLVVRASESVEITGVSPDGESSSILSAATRGSGAAGNLRIETGQMLIGDGAQVSVSSEGSGATGNLEVVARSIQLDNRGQLTAEATSGNQGNISLRSQDLQLRQNSSITANARGSAKGGNINIDAGGIRLDNSHITTETLSDDGGNIGLQVQDLLLMRNNSLISTNAGTEQKGGNGGNITINSPFIVAVPKENSDITANAFTGNGGNINITTQGIYGLQFRPRRTPKSDITASSDFGVNGTVLINSAFDVTQSVTNLPVDLVDASNQIDQTCTPAGAQKREKNRFIITGRGGLPPNPNEPLPGESVITNWVTLDSQEEQQSQNTTSTKNRDRATSVPKTPTLVEAQGWVYGSQGEVILTAQSPTVTPHSVSQMPTASCNPPSSEFNSK
ncbi:MAG: hypothetical protein Fur006_08610 [Coleofasciculaceae cyanobacterium]